MPRLFFYIYTMPKDIELFFCNHNRILSSFDENAVLLCANCFYLELGLGEELQVRHVQLPFSKYIECSVKNYF